MSLKRIYEPGDELSELLFEKRFIFIAGLPGDECSVSVNVILALPESESEPESEPET